MSEYGYHYSTHVSARDPFTLTPLSLAVFLQGVCAGPEGGAASVAEKDQQDGMRVVAPSPDRALSSAVSLGLRLVAFLSLLWLCV